jgi:hypothetical protein
MSTTRELYLVVEVGDFTAGVQFDGASERHRDETDLRIALCAFSVLPDIEAAIRTRWPGRAYWIEQDLGDGARYQLVEYGAFAGKPHKQAVGR